MEGMSKALELISKARLEWQGPFAFGLEPVHATGGKGRCCVAFPGDK